MVMKNKLHYGWIVSIGCSIMIFYTYGLAMNVFSVFIQPLIDTLHLTKGQGSSIPSVINIAGIFAMIVSGKIYNALNIRLVSFVYGTFVAAGFVLFSFADSLLHCYLAAVLVGLGWGGGSIIPVSILISRWFNSSQGLALGIATVGSGLATMIYPSFLAKMIESNGLSYSFLFQALNVFILVIISHIMIRNVPADKNLEPYEKKGHIKQENSALGSNQPDLIFKEERRSIVFYKMTFVSFLIGISVIPLAAHLSVVLNSFDYSPVYAGYMVSLFGIFMIIGKVLYGWLADVLSYSLSNIYIVSLWVIGLSLAFTLHLGNPTPLFFAALTGLGSPIGTVGLPVWTEKVFGKRDYSLFFTTFIVAYNVGSVTGMLLTGVIADATGSYASAFILYILSTILAYFLLKTLPVNRSVSPLDN